MKFTSKAIVNSIDDSRSHTGFIRAIREVTSDSKIYLEVQVELDDHIISIWCSDDVTRNHPMYEVFEYFVTEETAEDFDLKELVGIQIEFTVMNLKTRGKKGEVERSFFVRVVPMTEEVEA